MKKNEVSSKELSQGLGIFSDRRVKTIPIEHPCRRKNTAWIDVDINPWWLRVGYLHTTKKAYEVIRVHHEFCSINKG